MKPSSPRATRRPLDRARARNAVFVNQFATPGLGSLMAGRWVAGSGQLILALTGFGFFVVWFAKTMVQYYGMITNDAPVSPVGWIGLTGLWIFVAAWLWSLVTSFSLLREARQNEAAMPVPPKL